MSARLCARCDRAGRYVLVYPTTETVLDVCLHHALGEARRVFGDGPERLALHDPYVLMPPLGTYGIQP